MNSKVKRILYALSGFAIVFIVWMIIHYLRIYNPIIFPSPFKIVEGFFGSLMDSFFLKNLGSTLMRVIIAFVISTVVGISVGLIAGYYKAFHLTTEQLIDFIRSIPSVAMFPLFILLLGMNDASRIAAAVLLASTIILISTREGVMHSCKLRNELSKVYKLGTRKMVLKVILPEASPYIFTGLKVSISFCVIVIIATEMLVGSDMGLGQLLVNSQYEFDIVFMYVILTTLGTVGFVLNLMFKSFEKKVFHWR